MYVYIKNRILTFLIFSKILKSLSIDPCKTKNEIIHSFVFLHEHAKSLCISLYKSCKTIVSQMPLSLRKLFHLGQKSLP